MVTAELPRVSWRPCRVLDRQAPGLQRGAEPRADCSGKPVCATLINFNQHLAMSFASFRFVKYFLVHISEKYFLVWQKYFICDLLPAASRRCPGGRLVYRRCPGGRLMYRRCPGGRLMYRRWPRGRSRDPNTFAELGCAASLVMILLVAHPVTHQQFKLFSSLG